MEDWKLLSEYVERNSESAFKELVSRYLNLVYSAAIRQVRQPQLAEEVSQAVFILLARKAHSLRRSVVLAGWLFRTTSFVAKRALRSELRRQQREQESVEMQKLSTSDDHWKEIAPVLDEAMEKLGQKDRDAILLRFFQGKNLKEVGMDQKISEEAAKKRVSRGMEKLRLFLQQRGVKISTIALGTTLGAHGAEAAPTEMISVAQAAFVATGAKSVGGGLAADVLTAWKWARIKLAALVGAVGVALIGTVSLTSLTHDMVEKGNSKSTVAMEQNGGGIVLSSEQSLSATNAPAETAFVVHVVEAETGKPISGAKIRASIWTSPVDERDGLTTDESGVCPIPLPTSRFRRLDVGAMKNGYVARFYTWRYDKSETRPDEYTLRLGRAISTGGWVKNENGEPVKNAEILFAYLGTGDSTAREFVPERVGYIDPLSVAKTGLDGGWTCNVLPTNFSKIRIEVINSEYPGKGWGVIGETETERDNSVKLADLVAGSAVFVLEKGITLTGQVVDEQSNAVAGASVGWKSGSEKVTTDPKGFFTVNNISWNNKTNAQEMKLELAINAQGFAPKLESVYVKSNQVSCMIVMKKGALLKIKVVDQNGEVLSNARVCWMGWNGESLYGSFGHDDHTDINGVCEWADAPAGILRFEVLHSGFMSSRENMAQADGKEYVIKLQPELRVSGSVVDAQTGNPISEFKAIPGYSVRNWFRSSTVHGTNGWFEVIFDEQEPPFSLRIEADGYEPAIRDSIDSLTSSVINVALTKTTTNQVIKGIVLQPDGTPAAGTLVALGTTDNRIWLGKAKLLSWVGCILTKTDTQGAFEFPPHANAVTVAAANETGIGQVIPNTNGTALLVQLEPWGRIEGTLNFSDAKIKGVSTWNPIDGQYRGGISYDPTVFKADVDGEGHFAIENVPPGKHQVMLNFGIGKPGQPLAWAMVEAGKTTTIQVEESGYRLVGRLVDEANGKINWNKEPPDLFLINLARKGVTHPSGLGEEEVRRWEVQFWRSSEGAARFLEPSNFQIGVNEDGSFAAYNVPAGKYELRGVFDAPPVAGDNGADKKWRYVFKTIIVPDGNGKLNLGDVIVK